MTSAVSTAPSAHRTLRSSAALSNRPRIQQAGDVPLTSGIVVGVDGSPSSIAALRWALREGVTRSVEVHVVYCWDIQPLHGFPVVPLDEGAGADREATSILARALAVARVAAADRPAGSPVRADVVEGRPASVLLHQAAAAQLLVVGTRGQGGFAGLVMGSVSQQCVAHAATSVVVVHDNAAGHESLGQRRIDRRIIVGVDGSEHSLAALRWALEEGTLRHAPVHVVCAWMMPVVVGTSPSMLPAVGEIRTAAQVTLATLMKKHASVGSRSLSSTITSEIVEGTPAVDLLIAATDGAALLVVGSRGRGGFTGLLLGSVSAQCAAYAPCPVVVVHEAGRATSPNVIAVRAAADPSTR